MEIAVWYKLRRHANHQMICIPTELIPRQLMIHHTFVSPYRLFSLRVVFLAVAMGIYVRNGWHHHRAVDRRSCGLEKFGAHPLVRNSYPHIVSAHNAGRVGGNQGVWLELILIS